MDIPAPLRCANCGTPLDPPVQGAADSICPVCQLSNRLGLAPPPTITLAALEAQLGELIARARAGGVPLDAIVHTLRDELEFAAEMASGGRDLCVQILDLGPRAGQPMRRSSRDESAMLRGRSVGGR